MFVCLNRWTTSDRDDPRCLGRRPPKIGRFCLYSLELTDLSPRVLMPREPVESPDVIWRLHDDGFHFSLGAL
jgi:hypothetical protein